MKVEQIQLAIHQGNFTNTDLNVLAESIRFKRSQLVKQNKRLLNVGDTVSFISARLGKKVTGTVEQIKVKNILIKSANDKWLVPASMIIKHEIEDQVEA